MNYERFCTAVLTMQIICNKINNETSDDFEFVVLQGIDEDDEYAKDPFIIQKITDFYNYNWQGNKDFMHIPNYEQVGANCNSHPIVICREKSTKEILGISTIKMEENSKDIIDPYYPFKGEKYFSITGILTKLNNKYSGIGKKIYEIAIGGFLLYNDVFNDTSLMCVIDCRNKNSVNAIYQATNNINDRLHINSSSKITGLYTVVDENKKMLEAPTLVINVFNNKLNNNERRIISYENQEDLFTSLLNTLNRNYGELTLPIVNKDEGVGIVSYYIINTDEQLPIIIPNNTELGNDRVPEEYSNIEAHYNLKLVLKKTKR